VALDLDCRLLRVSFRSRLLEFILEFIVGWLLMSLFVETVSRLRAYPCFDAFTAEQMLMPTPNVLADMIFQPAALCVI